MDSNENVRSRFEVGISGSDGDGGRDVDSGNVDRIASERSFELADALALAIW